MRLAGAGSVRENNLPAGGVHPELPFQKSYLNVPGSALRIQAVLPLLQPDAAAAGRQIHCAGDLSQGDVPAGGGCVHGSLQAPHLNLAAGRGYFRFSPGLFHRDIAAGGGNVQGIRLGTVQAEVAAGGRYLCLPLSLFQGDVPAGSSNVQSIRLGAAQTEVAAGGRGTYLLRLYLREQHVSAGGGHCEAVPDFQSDFGRYVPADGLHGQGIHLPGKVGGQPDFRIGSPKTEKEEREPPLPRPLYTQLPA